MSLCVLDTVEENPYHQCGKWAELSAPSDSFAFVAMSGRAPRFRRPNAFWPKPHCPSICRAESSKIARPAAAHPRIGRPGAGKAACLAFRLPPSWLAEAQYNVPCPGRRGPSIYREGRNPPRTPPEPHMCAECEDNAEGKIVLDTARGGAYYSILRQARKRLSESRGGHPRRREP